jgi:hypothetical protein
VASSVQRISPEPLAARLRAALLTGVPFGIFKIGGGWAAWHDLHPAVGAVFMAWGAIDVALNLAAVIHPRRVSYCLLSNAGRLLDHRRTGATEQLLLALDTLLSFGIVSSMILAHRMAALPPVMVRVWELAVVANILGVGVGRVNASWEQHRQKRG